MLDRIDRNNAALVAWAADFVRRYPVHGLQRNRLGMVTYWMMFGLGEAWQTTS